MDNLLMIVIGVVFLAGGAYIVKGSMNAKNLFEAALFGLFGMVIGLFLLGVVFFGPPD